MTRPGKTNTAERQLDGVQNNHLTRDCVPQRKAQRRHGGSPRPRLRSVDVLSEVLFLLPDRSPEDIAQALGYAGPGSIARAMHRLGERDLARMFDRAQRKAVGAG